LVVATFVIFLVAGWWSSRRTRALGLELETLPPDMDQYARIDWNPRLFAKLCALTAGIVLLVGAVGAILAPVEWRGLALLPTLFMFPILWLGFIAYTFPLKCKTCGALMKVHREEERLGGIQKVTFRCMCTQCKCVSSEFITD
jgi:hypothetical protein